MQSLQTTGLPLSSYPDDIQQRVLEFVSQADLCRLKLVSRTEKAVVDKFFPLLMKKELIKEGPELKEGLEDCHKNAAQNYARLCKEGSQENCPDQNYDEISSIFTRFKTKCEKLLPELPSVREDSFGLLFHIRDQHPTKMLKLFDEMLVDAGPEEFDRICAAHWCIKKDSFDLVGIQRAQTLFNGVPIARVYNTQMMMEFVQKSLEEIEKIQTT